MQFNINEEWLRTGEGEMMVHSPATEIDALAKRYALSDFDKMLVAEYAALSPEQRDAVRQFAANLHTRLTSETVGAVEEMKSETVKVFRAARGGGAPQMVEMSVDRLKRLDEAEEVDEI